jgi:hypothetical protein
MVPLGHRCTPGAELALLGHSGQLRIQLCLVRAKQGGRSLSKHLFRRHSAGAAQAVTAMTAQRPEPPLFHRSLNLLRRGSQDLAQRLTDLVLASALFSEETTFRIRSLGMRNDDFDGSASEVERALEEAAQATKSNHDKPFVLGTARENPALILVYYADPMAVKGSYDRVEIHFDLSRPLLGNSGLFSFGNLMKYIAVCVDAFDAATAAVHDSRLFELVASAYTHEKSMQSLPPSEHKYIPVPEIVEITAPALVERLSRVRHPTTFDLTLIPPAVFWINYWSARQVQALGADRVRKAGWSFLAELPGGGLLLASQREEFDALNQEHLETLAKLADRLDLYSFQITPKDAGKRL